MYVPCANGKWCGRMNFTQSFDINKVFCTHETVANFSNSAYLMFENFLVDSLFFLDTLFNRHSQKIGYPLRDRLFARELSAASILFLR
jgi:hypothetical protein